MEVRPFLDSDLEQVLEVLRLSLGEPPGLTRTPELFAWKHLANPFGKSLMLVAEEEGRIAGFRAFMRWQLIAPDGIAIQCVRAVDTATHPDFQRRGVFRSLTLTGIEMATDEGVDLIFNTPNEKSGAGYLTMGWRQIGRIGAMIRPGLGLLFGRQQASSENPNPFVEANQLASLRPDRPPLGLRTPRSPEYLTWRFASHPTGRYLLSAEGESYAIGRVQERKGRHELRISELGGSGSQVQVGTLRTTWRPDYTVAWFSPQSPERRIAWMSGLVPVPGASALTLMARPLRDLPIDLDWKNWDISLGDLELL